MTTKMGFCDAIALPQNGKGLGGGALMNYCYDCGTKLVKGHRFCGQCGTATADNHIAISD